MYMNNSEMYMNNIMQCIGDFKLPCIVHVHVHVNPPRSAQYCIPVYGKEHSPEGIHLEPKLP